MIKFQTYFDLVIAEDVKQYKYLIFPPNKPWKANILWSLKWNFDVFHSAECLYTPGGLLLITPILWHKNYNCCRLLQSKNLKLSKQDSVSQYLCVATQSQLQRAENFTTTTSRLQLCYKEQTTTHIMLSEGDLEVLIPAIVILVWVIVLVVVIYLTYYCLKKRPQSYRIVSPRLTTEMRTTENFGYDQPAWA